MAKKAVKKEIATPKIEEIKEKKEKKEEKERVLSVFETANYFGVNEDAIRLWLAHGKLQGEEPRGSGIPLSSIKNFRMVGNTISTRRGANIRG